MAPKVEKLPIEKCELGEGPHWDEKSESLFWVDLTAGAVHYYNTHNQKHNKQKIGKDTVSFLIPVAGTSNSFVCGEGLDIKLLEWNTINDTVKQYKTIEVIKEKETNRLNDAKCDKSGRLWLGTMAREIKENEHEGGFYNYTPKTKLTNQMKDIGISNGITWSSDDETMFYIDSMTCKIDAFSFDKNLGTIVNRRPVFNLKNHNCEGFPDGMTIDTTGNLWVACFEGNQVICVDPEYNKLVTSIAFPASQITSVAFGGKHLDELYVTSANQPQMNTSLDLTLEDNSEAGAVFRVTGLGVKGSIANKMNMKVD